MTVEVKANVLSRSDVTVIGMAELRANLSEILDRVEAGEYFLITRYGVPVAGIVPVSVGFE